MEVLKGLRLRGRVKCFYNARRFGFITAQGKDFFFHIDINSKLSLKEGQMVEFIVDHDKRGRLQAKRVRLMRSNDSKGVVRISMNRSQITDAGNSDSESEESEGVESDSNADEPNSSNASSDDKSNVEKFDILRKDVIGCIISFNTRKGFGFILNDDDKKKMFFHKNNCLQFDFHSTLRSGCYVKYDVARSIHKTALEAINVLKFSNLQQDNANVEMDTEIDENVSRVSVLNQNYDDEVQKHELAEEDFSSNQRDFVEDDFSSNQRDFVEDASKVDIKWMVRMKSPITYPNEAKKEDTLDYLAHTNAFSGPENRHRRGGNEKDRMAATQGQIFDTTYEPMNQNLPNEGLQPKVEINKPSDVRRKKRTRSKGVKTSGDASKATPNSYSALCEQNDERKPRFTSTAEESVRPKPSTDVIGVDRRLAGLAEQTSPEPTSNTTSEYSGRYSARQVVGAATTSQTKPTTDVIGVDRRLAGLAERTSPEPTSNTTSEYSGRYSARQVVGGTTTSLTKTTVNTSGLERRLSSREEQTSTETVSNYTSDHSVLRYSLRRDGVTEKPKTKPTVDRSGLERRLSERASRAEKASPDTVSNPTSACSGRVRSVGTPEASNTKTAVVRPLNNDIDQLEIDYKSYLNLGDNTPKTATETVRTEINRPSTTTLVNGVRGTIVKSPQFSRSGEIKTLSHGTVSLPMRTCHQYMGSAQLKPGTKVLFDMIYSDLNKDNIAVNIKTIQKNDSSCVVC